MTSLDLARAALAELEGLTGTFTSEANRTAQVLDVAQQEARKGGTLAAVVQAQGEAQAARSLLELHRQDVEQARRLVLDLVAAEGEAALLEEGREAHRLMTETARTYAERATAAEAALTAALGELESLDAEHRRAQHRLGAALRRAGGDVYGQGDRLDATMPRQAGRDWLAQVHPDLREHDALGVGGLGLSERLFPLLARVYGRR